MKIWDAIKALYAKVDSVLECAVMYVGATALDIISSLHMPPGFSEQNPFAKHADGSFWLGHALITNGVNTVETILLSAGLYVGARTLESKHVKFLAGLPWLYYGWVHLDAAFTNALYRIPGLYVHSAQDMLRSLFGG